jgi:hypothetical protein
VRRRWRRRWDPMSSSLARTATCGVSSITADGEFELSSGWLCKEGAAWRRREGGNTLQRKSLRKENTGGLGGRFAEATKMQIPRRRQNGALEKIDSIQSTLGISSFDSTHQLFWMKGAYNLSRLSYLPFGVSHTKLLVFLLLKKRSVDAGLRSACTIFLTFFIKGKRLSHFEFPSHLFVLMKEMISPSFLVETNRF